MKTRTSPIVLGFIWGIFSMLLCFAVVSVFASLQVVFNGFPLFSYDIQMQYILIATVFLLSVLGAIGAGIANRLPRLGGTFILISSIGVALLLFAPVLMQSFSFAPLSAYGIIITPFALLIADFTMVLFTAIGLAGGILAFIPKRDRRALEQLAPQPAVLPEPLPITADTQPAPPIPPELPPVPIQPEVVRAGPVPVDINMMNLE